VLAAALAAWWLTRRPATNQLGDRNTTPVVQAPPAHPEPRPVVVPLSAEEQSASQPDKPEAKALPVLPPPRAPSSKRPPPELKRSKRRRSAPQREEPKQVDVETEWK
jgi:hypothetical protein